MFPRCHMLRKNPNPNLTQENCVAKCRKIFTPLKIDATVNFIKTACLTDPEREKFLLRVHRVSGFTGRVNPGFSKILSGLRVSVSGFLLFLPGFLWNRSRVCGFKPGADFWDRVGPGWLIFPPGWTRAGSVRQAVLLDERPNHTHNPPH